MKLEGVVQREEYNGGESRVTKTMVGDHCSE